MYRSLSTTILALSVAFLLAACGGGGGNDDAYPAVTFDPEKFVANYTAGTTQLIDIAATATRPKDFEGHTLYVYIVDENQLLTGTVDLNPIDDETVLVTLETSALTEPGNYTGDFTVQLCKDPACDAQFPGSPVKLPYDITVTP